MSVQTSRPPRVFRQRDVPDIAMGEPELAP